MKFKDIFSILFVIIVVYFIFHFIRLRKGKIKEESKIEEAQGIRHEKNFILITCPTCNGSRRLYDKINEREKTCFVCSGMGQKRIPKLMEGQSICGGCRGMGKRIRIGRDEQPLGYDKCPLCRGKGITSL